MGKVNSVPVSISGGGYLMLAMGLLILPLRWLGGILIAAAFHELCHVLMIHLTGGKIQSIRIGAGGASILAEPMTAEKELLCALAGPLGGLLLLLFFQWIPYTAFCGTVQSMYNLLPIYPLDGGRAVRQICRLTLPPEQGRMVCIGITWLCIVCLLFLGIYGIFFLHLGLIALIPGIAALLREKKNSLLYPRSAGIIA